MDFATTTEQRDLADAARRHLSERFPPSRLAATADHGLLDPEDWAALDRQGWLDAELGPVDLALLAEESGRALLPQPWVGTAGSALPVYQSAGLPLPGPAALVDSSDTCAAHDTPDWRISGSAPGVVDAHLATELVVAATTRQGVALFGVAPSEVSIAERDDIDPLRRYATVRLLHAPARLLADPGRTAELLPALRLRSAMLLACEAVGVADGALAEAVRYAGTRTQFGQPIGSFQAVAHQLAEAYAEIETARSLAYRAAVTLNGEGAAEAVACAAVAGPRAAVLACEVALQVCGGIAMTWEFGLHLRYRRALWLDAHRVTSVPPHDVLAALLLS
ncbi:acyl-CoA dehydrogenase family protein [Micromonospora sp. DT15]|uniref:acyl-CoA dehydrogenase family protein n=1 Tax=Micromonospora sp. DT15 TaxID=3393445 RepID=UPI003CE76580